MKKKFYFLKILLIAFAACIMSCQRDDKKNIVEYLKWPEGENALREYVNYLSDSTMQRIFVHQQYKEITPSGWEFEYAFTRIDSIPIMHDIERFYDNNDIEIAEYSLFEMDPEGKPLPVKAEIISGKKQTLNNLKVAAEMMFRFKSDTAMAMKVSSELFYNYQFVDSLKMDCLIVNSKNKILFIYTDGRQNATVYSDSERLYGKGKGLLQFADINGTDTVKYRLNEQHPE